MDGNLHDGTGGLLALDALDVQAPAAAVHLDDLATLTLEVTADDVDLERERKWGGPKRERGWKREERGWKREEIGEMRGARGQKREETGERGRGQRRGSVRGS